MSGMMTIRTLLHPLVLMGLCMATTATAARPDTLDIVVSNPLHRPRQGYPVSTALPAGHTWLTATATCNGQPVAVQLDDLDGDCRHDALALLIDVPANGDAHVQVILSDTPQEHGTPAPRTRGYIKLHDEKGKHPEIKSITYPGDANLLDMYNSIYGHGAVLENEHMAYRIYMDNRQSIDLYGKTHHQLELDSTGFYTTPQQLAQGYGCDVLWAGQSVGAGSFRGLRQGRPCYIDTVAYRRQTVLAEGPVRTIVEVTDIGWLYQGQRIDMTQRYTLYAGRRDMEVLVSLDGDTQGMTFCTGVQKLEEQNQGFVHADGLCASWGSNVPDKAVSQQHEQVGLAVYPYCYGQKAVREDEHNYIVTLTPRHHQIGYRLATCAGREEGGFRSAAAWFDFLRQWQEELDKPCRTEVVRRP